MSIQTTYSQARENFASLLDQVTDDLETVIIKRRGRADVAMISAAELSSLLETAHLLRSPKNAQRLLKAMARAQSRIDKPERIEKLREEFGINAKK